MRVLAHSEQQAAATARYRGSSGARDMVDRRRRAHGTRVADCEEQIEARFSRLLRTGQVPAEAFSAAVASPEPVERQVLLERIIGATNDLQPVRFLTKGARAVQSIARVSLNHHGALAPRGTGFLVSPRLLLTNNHVLPDRTDAARAVVEFNYEVGVDGHPAAVATHLLDPDTLFLTDAELDYTLVTVRADGPGRFPGATFGWNRLISEQGKIVNGESINVVGHPMGRLKEIAIRDGELCHQHDSFLNYTTDTEQGSSGSPVFNDQWEVVALHHAAIPMRDAIGAADNGHRPPPERSHAFVNEGARVSVLLRDIMQQPVSAAQRAVLDELFQPAGSTGAVVPAAAVRDGSRPRQAAAARRAPLDGHGHGTAAAGDIVWIDGVMPVALPGRA